MTVRRLFVMIIAIMVLLSGAACWTFLLFVEAMEKQQDALEYRHSALLLSGEMTSDSAGLTNNVRLYGVTGDTRYKKDYMYILDSSAGKVARKDGTIISFDKKVEDLGLTDQEKDALLNAKQLSNGLAKIETEVMSIIDSYVDTYGAKQRYVVNNDDELRAQLFRLYDDVYFSWLNKIGKQVAVFNDLLFERVQKNIEETTAESEFYKVIFFSTLLGLVIIVLSLLIFALFFLRKRLGGEPEKLAVIAERIAGGELDIELQIVEGDTTSLFSSIGRMVDTLRENITEISIKTEEANSKAATAEDALQEAHEAKMKAESAKAEGLLDAANRLALVVSRVSEVGDSIKVQASEVQEGTEAQGARILSTVTAMEQMNATVLEVAKNSSEAAEVGKTTHLKAREGMDVVSKSVSAMETTQAQTETLREDMLQLGKQAESIGEILNVISDIADQTNLLALNAAIEAARAGDAGRGFAVVADEVRKLAEKTMSATKEVGDAISGIQDATRRNIQSMEKSVQDIMGASELTSLSGQALQEIMKSVELSAGQVEEIATAAEEQSATSEEINASISDISRIANENSASISRTTETLSKLSHLIVDFSSLIEELEREGRTN